ncbi:MAG: beta-1,3-glucanase family protein, partial [Planctomycetia bacterium]
DVFFTHYATNTFSIYRDGLTLTGNTVDGGETGTVSFTYNDGSPQGKTVSIYGRALRLTDTTNSNNQFVFLDPSSPYLAKNTWMGVTTNLGYSAGYQIFAAAGAAGDGGPANAVAIGTANPWKDLQNSIATAFDRGLATNFTLAPNAWATPPQFSAPATVATGTPGTLQSVPYTYAVTGIIQGGQETTLGVLTSVKPTQAGSSARLQWSTAPTGAPPPTGSPPVSGYQSFNLYRAQGYPGQSLSFKKVNNNPILLPTTGQTVTYVDKGGTATKQPSAQPVSYFAAGTTSDVYAAFMHRMGVNGRSYGYAYDDQGALASTSSIDYLQAAWLTVQPWGTVAASFLAVDPLPASIRAKDTIDTVNPVDLTHLTIGLQTMAGARKWADPVFGSTVGQSVRVTASNLTGVGVGTKALVSYTNGRAALSLSGASPASGETYSLTLQLFNEVTGLPITAVKPVTVTIKTF